MDCMWDWGGSASSEPGGSLPSTDHCAVMRDIWSVSRNRKTWAKCNESLWLKSLREDEQVHLSKNLLQEMNCRNRNTLLHASGVTLAFTWWTMMAAPLWKYIILSWLNGQQNPRRNLPSIVTIQAVSQHQRNEEARVGQWPHKSPHQSRNNFKYVFWKIFRYFKFTKNVEHLWELARGTTALYETSWPSISILFYSEDKEAIILWAMLKDPLIFDFI